MGLASFADARVREVHTGHLRARWAFLGEAAGCRTVGVRRIEIAPGGWSTPAHEHGREEEIFYVLGGRGISWQGGSTAEVGGGDCIVYLPNHGAHTLHAADQTLDVLAFGPRLHDESAGFPRLGMSLVGARAVESVPHTINGAPIQFVREAAIGPPELPAVPGGRPATIVNLAEVQPVVVQRPRISRRRRKLSAAAGSLQTGLQHVELDPGSESGPQHCHSVEEEIFVILDGDGWLVLDDERTAVGPEQVVVRPAGTGVCHMLVAGERGLTYLAYGPREPADMCWYRRSSKVAFRGLGVIARVQALDYWDGED